MANLLNSYFQLQGHQVLARSATISFPARTLSAEFTTQWTTAHNNSQAHKDRSLVAFIYEFPTLPQV